MNIRVENLANIEEANININNLTLFVGQNSTHKSYLAHTVYEFYKESLNIVHNWNKRAKFTSLITNTLIKENIEDIKYLLTQEKEVSEERNKYLISEDDWEEEVYTIIKIKIDTDDQIYKNIIEKIGSLFLIQLTKTIDESFNNKEKILEKLILLDDKFFKNPIKESIDLRFNIPLEFFEEDKEDLNLRLISNLITRIINEYTEKFINFSGSYYFPASRTGFVLTLDEIYAGIFRDKFRGQATATRLGEPTIDFIQTFADIKTGKKQNNSPFSLDFLNQKSNGSKESSEKLISFLEKEIIKGKIEEIRNDQDYASYYLKVNETRLDLHLASSATLETLPFIVFLRNTQNIEKTLFVIEEPEAHLHPKAQIQMAKFLVLLSNTGAKVLVTTHSDYILNEINNCIKLYTLKESSDFSINKDDISAYLFKNEEIKTTVNKLNIDKFGISNDNFDEVLNELLDNSGDLNERIEENE